MTRSLWLRVYDMQLYFALFRLGFPPAPELLFLNLAAYRNSQAHSTKGTLLPIKGCNILSVYGFRFYFTPLTGVLFIFPSRYLSAIGSQLVFSLGSWSTRIPTGFLVSRRTQVLHRQDDCISRTGISPSLSGFPKTFPLYIRFLNLLYVSPCSPTTPV